MLWFLLTIFISHLHVKSHHFPVAVGRDHITTYLYCFDFFNSHISYQYLSNFIRLLSSIHIRHFTRSSLGVAD